MLVRDEIAPFTTLSDAVIGLAGAMAESPIAIRPMQGGSIGAMGAPAERPSEGDPMRFAAELALAAGFVVEQVQFYEEDLEKALARGAPFVFVPRGTPSHVYAVAGGSGGALSFVEPSGRVVRRTRADAKRCLSLGNESTSRAVAERLLGSSAVDPRAFDAVASELRGALPIGWGCALRPNVGRALGTVVESLRLRSYSAQLLGISLAESFLVTAGWALIGSLAIVGHATRGNILGWSLVCLTAAAVQLGATRLVGRFTIRASTALRQRLLEGALGLAPEGLASYGLGGLMVVAAQADSFLSAVIGLFIALLGVLTNVTAAAIVLYVAPMPLLSLVIFFAFVLGVIAAVPRVSAHASNLQRQRMALGTDMVERMVGHRTRLVQQEPSAWHDGEDAPLRRYARDSRRASNLGTTLRAVPRAYHLVSVGVIFLLLVAHPTPEVLALSIGGMTLGMASLTALVSFVLSAADLRALWQAIQPIVRDEPRAADDIVDADLDVGEASRSAIDPKTDAPVLELRSVRFGYTSRTKPVLDDAAMKVHHAERVLVEGVSGGGKTTLVSLLTGLRKPDAGLVLVRGLDQHTVREADLSRTIASAPQFYKNHVFSQSLAFNLLLGRAWPPSEDDLREATLVARALGLGPLLERMPSGIFQFVGENGWQLSHGEKSRVYLARTLLQPAEVVILDETFGALDPDTLRACMKVVLERTTTLLVITHR